MAEKRWADIVHMPEYPEFARQERSASTYSRSEVDLLMKAKFRNCRRSSSLAHWYQVRSRSTAGYNLLTRLFEYDPKKRVTAKKALDHVYFVEEDPLPMRK
jgi:serine/threonine protein kinase